jgi:hypothetical protein
MPGAKQKTAHEKERRKFFFDLARNIEIEYYSNYYWYY